MNTEMKDTIKIMENLPEQIQMFGVMVDTESGELSTFCDSNKNIEDYTEIGQAVKDDAVFKAHVYALFAACLAFEENDNNMAALYRLVRTKLKEPQND